MTQLLLANFIWAFSFPVIGYFVSPFVDSFAAIFLRCVIAFCVFAFFIKSDFSLFLRAKLMLIGAVQIAFMYIFYYKSFAYLKVSEVALFTIFTPIYVYLIHEIIKKNLSIKGVFFVFLGVLACFIIKDKNISSQEFFTGFLLIQIANLSFAAAQVAYKITAANISNQRAATGYFFAGACVLSGINFLIFGDFSRVFVNFNSIIAIIYLGLIASSLGYFLWNQGAVKVSAPMLALMNNALIPISVLIDVLIFGAKIDYANFLLGAFLLTISLFLAKKYS